MAHTTGDILVERIDTGGLNAAAVDQLLAQRRGGLPQNRLALRYGVSVRRVREIERAARDLPVHQAADTVLAIQRAGVAADKPAAEPEQSDEPAVDPVMLLTAWLQVAARMERLCDRVEELRDIPEKPDRAMTRREREVWDLLRTRGAMQAADILDAVGSTGSNVRRILRNLRGFGAVVKSGTTQSAYYAAVADAPGARAGTRAARPEPTEKPDRAPRREQAAAEQSTEPRELTDGEAKLLRALIRQPGAPLPDLCKAAGVSFGQANGLHQSLKRKGYIATEGGQRRILRRPDGQRMPRRSDAELQAQVEAAAAAGRVTKCPTRFAAESQAGDPGPVVSTQQEGRVG